MLKRRLLPTLTLLLLAAPAVALQFSKPVYLPALRGPSLMLAGDLNGDQRADILVTSGTQIIADLYLSSGTTWTGPTNIGPQIANPLSGIADLSLADIDGDGDLDILCASGNGTASDGVRVMLNDGAAHFTLHQNLVMPDPRIARAVDLDGTGWLDVLTLTNGWGLKESRSPALGDYSTLDGASFPYSNPPGTRPVDGHFQSGSLVGFASIGGVTGSEGEFVVSASRVGPSYSGTSPLLLSSAGPAHLTRADLDRDGADDIFVRHDSYAEVVFGDLISGFQIGPSVELAPSTVLGSALGDLDLDGNLDVLVGREAPELRFLKGNGDGTFTFHSTLPGRTGTQGLLIADLDNNGSPDIVTVSDSLGIVSTRRLGIRLNLTSPLVLGVGGGSAALELHASPNPSAGAVDLAWSLARDEARVSVDVLDLAGRVVQRLHEGPLQAGAQRFRWNGVTAAGPAAPGVYLARIRTSNEVRTVRIARVR